jgi:predicted transcriptional regulator
MTRADFKKKITMLGMQLTDFAKMVGVQPKTIDCNYKKDDKMPFHYKTIIELLEKNKQLEEQNSILKQTLALLTQK